MNQLIQRVVLFLYQLAMYVAHIAAAPSEVEWTRGHPMYLCNWLPRELLSRLLQWRLQRKWGVDPALVAYGQWKKANQCERTPTELVLTDAERLRMEELLVALSRPRWARYIGTHDARRWAANEARKQTIAAADEERRRQWEAQG